jgi:hypothetical protein
LFKIYSKATKPIFQIVFYKIARIEGIISYSSQNYTKQTWIQAQDVSQFSHKTTPFPKVQKSSGVLKISCQSDKIQLQRIDNERRDRV